MTVKKNQKELFETLETLFTPQRFSPSAHGANPRDDAGKQPGRREIRVLDCRMLPPAGGFPRRSDHWPTPPARPTSGKKTTETVYLIGSLTLEELDAAGLLKLKRGYWVIESRLHHALDVTLAEDHSRVRQPKAAFALSRFRRVVVSFAQAWLEQCVNSIRAAAPPPAGSKTLPPPRRRSGPVARTGLLEIPASWRLPN